MEYRITVLVDNTVSRAGLCAEHGLALLIETGALGVLFDTGAGPLLLRNARELELDLDGLDAIVLSHNHCGHTGGLEPLLQVQPARRIWAHPQALRQSYAKPKGDATRESSRRIGTDLTEESLRALGAEVMSTQEPTEIRQGIWVTGQIPRRFASEEAAGRFFRDPERQKPDPLSVGRQLTVQI